LIVKVIYCRSRNLGSWMLRTALWSKWSHCAIVTPEKTVIEAAAFHGVREVPFDGFIAQHSACGVRVVSVPDARAALRFARAQIGKPYDWQGVFGLALRDDAWQDDSAWFCSELVEAVLAHGGRQRFVNDAQRVTPQHSWMVA
jgi:uncharacterized protein YycO